MSSGASVSVAPPRGMRDFLPQQVALRDWAIETIQATYKRYGFSRIETPVLEHIQLLRGGEGGENLQLIYEVLKRGEKLDKILETPDFNRDELSDLGLRFDLTVPLVRYYSANQSNLPNPLKSLQIGSVFRAESPQKGRFRQFTQCDIDIIGVKSELAEMELISASSEALLALGFENFTILINDRRFLSGLAEHCGFDQETMPLVFIALDKLEKIGLDNVRKELLDDSRTKTEPTLKLCSILQVYLDRMQEKSGKLSFDELTEIFPSLAGSDCLPSLKKIIAAVEKNSNSRFQIKFEPTLVRGMGYYTGAIFEAKYPGYSGSIAGGGRYDKMVGKFSGRDVPACGFSIGFERVIDILTDKGFEPQSAFQKIALVVDPDRDDPALILEAAARLRTDGHIVSIQVRKKDMKKQLDALVLQGYTQYCPFKGDLDDLELRALAAK
ncbi:MAG: histidine--tRNA ligase [Candidatus Obscuribacterales bacterium]|nr:histidine--tRNA ligase [Candidatus Obscuribacterales bacterium]